MSGRVRPDGTISLGWYGDVDAAGLTVAELKEKIINRLRVLIKDQYLGLVVLDPTGEPGLDPATGEPKPIDPKDSAKIRVTVTRCNSKFFYVYGEVWSPGRFPFTGSEKILDAIKAAEGMNEAADREKIYLYRGSARRAGALHV